MASGVSIRPEVTALPVYRPGKAAPPGPGGVSYKLSSNENPFPPLPGVLEAVAEASRQLNRYPDATNAVLAVAVAQSLSTTDRAIAPEQLSFGTGSVAVLYSLLQAVCRPGDEVVYAWRSFEAYPIAVQACGARPVPVCLTSQAEHDLDAMLAALNERTRAILVCTPNNPTGPVLGHDAVAEFLDAVPPHVLVVVDEAYVEFVTDPGAVRGLDLLLRRPNVAVLRTFSKAYGLAGFRVGYCVADPALAAAVSAVAVPFGVSIAAQAAVVASLREQEALLERVGDLVRQRDELAERLRALGFEIPAAQANFVWLPAGERTEAYADAFADAGVMVRPYVAGDAHDGVRITVGEADANDLVLETAKGLPR